MSKFTKILSVVALAGAIPLMASGTAEAQRRGGRVGARVIVAPSFGYGPWFYSPWYGYPFGYPFGYPYPPYGYGLYDNVGSVRVQVEPKQTEVFVDGYYAGIVDDFDGAFQRLRVHSGEHEITLYLQGYRSFHQKVYLQPDRTFDIKRAMEPLGPGEAPEERPVAPAPPPQDSGNAAGRRAPEGPPPARRGGGPARNRVEAGFGSIVLQVQPADTEILVDGQPWQASGGATRLVIQLSEGEHRIEIRKPGYVPYQSTIRVQSGDSTPINVSLSQQ